MLMCYIYLSLCFLYFFSYLKIKNTSDIILGGNFGLDINQLPISRPISCNCNVITNFDLSHSLTAFLTSLYHIFVNISSVSVLRICLQTRNARNASTKFRKTLESKKAEKSLEISAFLFLLVFFGCIDGGDQDSFYLNTSVKNRFIVIISTFNQKLKPIFCFGAFLEGNM